MKLFSLLALLLAVPALAADVPIAATVVEVVDGDTIKIDVPAWSSTPFQVIDVRIAGIDTPETRKPPAKCVTEVKRGLAAKVYARGLVAPGQAVGLTYLGRDKYFRIDGAIALPDGRDFAGVMLASGLAAPYTGAGPKRNWCSRKPI